jgi:hypothetical protein
MDVDAESLHKVPLWHLDECLFTIEQIQHMLTKKRLHDNPIFNSGWSLTAQSTILDSKRASGNRVGPVITSVAKDFTHRHGQKTHL